MSAGIGRAATVHTAIDFDDRLGPLARAAGAGREFVDVELTLDGNRDIHAAGKQGHEPVDFDGADNLVRHEDRAEARIGEDFGLSQLGDGDADRSGCELTTRDLGGLWRLEVGPELRGSAREEGGHRRDVPLHDVEVEEEAGRVEVADFHAGESTPLGAIE